MPDLDGVLSIIKESTGIDPVSIGISTIERSVRLRMAQVGVATFADYIVLLKQDAELQALINEVTVPETWFCRDNEPFKLLADYASRVWRPAERGDKFRALSVPCSSGEEPYSIAMTLFEAGFSPDELHVDAIDINTNALAKAKQGLYGNNSFRGSVAVLRSKYFTKESPGIYRICDEVRSAVSFDSGNVVADEFRDQRQLYDVIFCRNLLIYFDIETKQKALMNLFSLLKKDGLLFVGHAETGRVSSKLFSFLRHPGAFAYQRLDVSLDDVDLSADLPPLPPVFSRLNSEEEPRADKVGPVVNVFESGAKGKAAPTVKAEARKHSVPPSTAANTAKGEPVEQHLTLDQIERLADQGELDEAEALCQAWLKSKPKEADAYFILGLISLARNKTDEAEPFFRKALFLQPNHHNALAYMVNLSESAGNRSAAESFRHRLRRLESLDNDG